uniref:NADH-ubiquinone oxidoreductase chain 5 n=1 Tax=Neomysis japonica TaxID=1676841 RepID=A0A0U2DEU6_9CRUS|nr:NADH dehydrogenase subunit 5 [Neomysis japonica]AKO62618.1 NADH dehydrogenase subunit 5 [Neomysis japonica]
MCYGLLFLMTLSSTMFMYLYFMNKTILVEWVIINMKSITFEMTIIIDQMSLLFMFVISLISASIFIYSSEYMMNDLNKPRFLMLKAMFIMSMMLMLFSPNLISLLLGWDGLGLVSYALVIFYQNEASVAAGTITALSNRVGDVAILLGIGMMFSYDSFSFYLKSMEVKFDLMLTGLCMLAAFTKSAQIPFSAWLPAAMAAPTPVSALVHSSTLVTAGVYLMIRFSSSLKPFMFILLVVGTYTMVMSGLAANLEYDLKKIIALSTLSQLGLMMFTLGMGLVTLSFFHLLTHALFKALLFMTAGSLIHAGKNYQDIRNLSGLVYYMPLTTTFMAVANLALCGFPFLAGFYSKDLIIELSLVNPAGMTIVFMLMFATGLTVSYTFRMLSLLLDPSSSFNSLLPSPETYSYMTFSMTLLGMMSIISGNLFMWFIIPTPTMICLPTLFKMSTLVVCFMGVWSGLYLSKLILNMNLNKNLINFLGSMWFLTKASTLPISSMFMTMSMMYSKIDKSWMEFSSAQKIKIMVKSSTQFMENINKTSMKMIMFKLLIWLTLLTLILT